MTSSRREEELRWSGYAGWTSGRYSVDAISHAESLPEKVRCRSAEARGIEFGSFDDSYLEFLDTRIRLSPRGPEWTERLKARGAGLTAYSGRPLLSGKVIVSGGEYWNKVDAASGAVVHSETYESTEVTPDP
jgi:hypothetical protein